MFALFNSFSQQRLITLINPFHLIFIVQIAICNRIAHKFCQRDEPTILAICKNVLHGRALEVAVTDAFASTFRLLCNSYCVQNMHYLFIIPTQNNTLSFGHFHLDINTVHHKSVSRFVAIFKFSLSRENFAIIIEWTC